MLLDDRQAVRFGEVPHGIQIRAARAMAMREFGTRQLGRPLTLREPLQPLVQAPRVARTHDHGDFQPLRGIRGAQGVRIGQWIALASLEWMSDHGDSSFAGSAVDATLAPATVSGQSCRRPATR